MSTYQGQFSGWADVQSAFHMGEDEPDEVFLADYDHETWEGSAEVFYRRGETFYYADGSHCSCYGLEDQWDPDDFTKEVFVAWLRRRADGYKKNTAAGVLAMVEGSQ